MSKVFMPSKKYPFLITNRQLEILNIIFRSQHFTGITPSMDEIRVRIGAKNRVTVKQHLDNLQRKGFLDWQKNANRSYRIPNHIRQILRYWQ